MASCGETVNESLEEAASQLSLDSSRDNTKRTLLLEFRSVRCIFPEVFALQPTVSGKLMTCQLLLSFTEDITCNDCIVVMHHVSYK